MSITTSFEQDFKWMNFLHERGWGWGYGHWGLRGEIRDSLISIPESTCS
jgi:hypothetical protein